MSAQPTITHHDDDVRDAWLRVSAAIAAAPDHATAVAIMRDVTGLTITDPDADRTILAQRIAAADGLTGQLPARVIADPAAVSLLIAGAD